MGRWGETEALLAEVAQLGHCGKDKLSITSPQHRQW